VIVQGHDGKLTSKEPGEPLPDAKGYVFVDMAGASDPICDELDDAPIRGFLPHREAVGYEGGRKHC
jgi:hypothetical protein